MANKKKPTKNELLKEIDFIGNKMLETNMLARNVGQVFDLYLLFKDDTADFTKFVTERLAEKKEEIKKAQEASKKKEPEKV